MRIFWRLSSLRPAIRKMTTLGADRRGFPWGANDPTVAQRLVVALLIATVAGAIHYFRSADYGGVSDFTTLWYGGRLLSWRVDPYTLVGPHLTIGTASALYYPAPALVAVIPFTILPFQWAGTLFVFISSLLLGYSATHDGWQRLPIFPSLVFVNSAQLGQWSIVMAAALFLPMLNFLAVVKPQSSLPVVGSATSRTAWVSAIAGAAMLLAISFALVPGWPASWWSVLTATDYFHPPIATFGGAAIALVLLRWRRPEAWLVLIAACTPQTWYPYNGLLLLLVAFTYREACTLSLISSVGWLLSYVFLVGGWRSDETRHAQFNLLIALGYLPAVIVVLRRPNEGDGPLWLSYLTRGRAPARSSKAN